MSVSTATPNAPWSYLGHEVYSVSTNAKELSGDPYDDLLMDSFCLYLEKSKKKLMKVQNIYNSNRAPIAA